MHTRPLKNAQLPETLNYRTGLPDTRPNLVAKTRKQPEPEKSYPSQH